MFLIGIVSKGFELNLNWLIQQSQFKMLLPENGLYAN